MIYCVINLGFVIYFIRAKKRQQDQPYDRLACLAVNLYIVAYVILEAVQVAVELEISGNIYRFLATFFIVSFFPVIGRLLRMFYMVVYIIIAQAALSYLKSKGIAVYSYTEINILIFMICLAGANIYYNSVIRNFELRQRLEYLSMKDELTGLANRRSMNQNFEHYWKIAGRSHSAVGVMMIDIDHFKHFNDTYGHQAGDECLKLVAGAISNCFGRTTDMTARYGGEEFVVVLPYTSAQELAMMAEKVRANVEDLAIEHTTNPPFGCVTCSIGIAIRVPRPDESYEILMRYADEALYEAKEKGRNLISLYESKSL